MGDPSYARWSAAIRQEIAALDDGAVVVGHSVGATILVNTLGDHLPGCSLSAIVLIAAPFVGAGGWPGDEFEPPSDLGARLPHDVPVHVFQGLQDKQHRQPMLTCTRKSSHRRTCTNCLGTTTSSTTT